MISRKHPIAAAVAFALIGMLQSGSALAQTPAKPETPQEKAEREKKEAAAKQATERIVVTATGRAQAASSVPYNVTAIDEEKLREENITDVKKLIADSVSIFAPGNSARFADSVSVRGLNIAPVNANNLEQFSRTTIAYYLDDTPLPNIGYRIKDIARVETLMGPQGTLYGGGSLGGTIRYITNAPKLNKTEGRVNTSFYATKGGKISSDLDVMFNLPLTETLALRGSVSNLDEKGYTDRVSNPPWRLGNFAWVTQPTPGKNTYEDDDFQRVKGGRLALLWQVKPGIEIKVAHTGQKQRANGTTGTSLLPLRVANATTPAEVEAAWRAGSGSFTNACVATNNCRYSNAFDTPPAVGRDTILSRYPEFADRTFRLDSFDLDWDLGFARLHSSTSFFEDKRVGMADYASQGEAFYFQLGDAGARIDSGRSAFITFNNKYEGLNHETRLTSKGAGPIQWIAGLYHTDQERSLRFSEFLPGLDAYNGVNRATSGGNVDEGYRENLASEYKETALYGEASYKPTPQWLLTVGARLFNYDDTGIAEIRDYSFDLVNNNVRRSGGDDGQSFFKFNASYEFNPGLLAYYTFSQGFRRGGTNPFRDVGTLRVTAENREYQPDSTDNHELGLKGFFLDRQLYVQTNVFQIDWKNPQTYRDQSISGFPVNGTVNGPDAKTKGWELHTRFKLSDAWQVTYRTAYTTGEWAETKVNCLYENNATRECRTWAKGGQLSGGPKWKHNAAVRYSAFLADGTSWWASLSGRYVGKTPVDRTDSPTATIRVRPAYALVNASAGTSFGNWDVNLWVQNVNNKRAEVSTQEGGIMGQRLIYATPRTIGLNVSHFFN